MKVPTIGESITEVTLAQWLVEDGDYVELDQPICEFESDKATLEFPAEASGKLTHVASEEDDLEIGALVAKIDTSVSKDDAGGGDSSGDGEAEAAKEKSEEKEEQSSAPATEKEEEPSAPAEEETKEESYAAGHPSPAAAKILKENDIDPERVKGTGRDGRITKDDAQKAVDAQKQRDAQPQPEAETSGQPSSGDGARKEATSPKKEDKGKSEAPKQVVFSSGEDFSRETERKKMSRMRRTIAKRLVSAKNETAMLTTFNEVDLTEVMQLRKKYQDRFVEKYGIKLGFMSIFAKACAKALMDMPDVNASIDEDHLIYHKYADISIAISTPNGLVVPPVHNVESLSFAEIEYKIKALAAKARDGKLSLEEMQGGTFTITNGGIFGSLISTPILNEPQSAILGMHAIKNRPVAIDGEVQIRPMMYLALSYDHRVVDGSTSVTFLVKVKEYLEDPITMLMDI